MTKRIPTKRATKGSKTPPIMMKAVTRFGGSTKFDTTPRGGGAMGVWARTELGIPLVVPFKDIAKASRPSVDCKNNLESIW